VRVQKRHICALLNRNDTGETAHRLSVITYTFASYLTTMNDKEIHGAWREFNEHKHRFANTSSGVESLGNCRSIAVESGIGFGPAAGAGQSQRRGRWLGGAGSECKSRGTKLSTKI